MLALLLDSVGPSRSLYLLFGIASPLTFVLSRETSLILFIDYLRLSSLTGPGSGHCLLDTQAVILTKFRRVTSRQKSVVVSLQACKHVKRFSFIFLLLCLKLRISLQIIE